MLNKDIESFNMSEHMGQFWFTVNANNSYDYTVVKDPHRSYLRNSFSQMSEGCFTTWQGDLSTLSVLNETWH